MPSARSTWMPTSIQGPSVRCLMVASLYCSESTTSSPGIRSLSSRQPASLSKQGFTLSGCPILRSAFSIWKSVSAPPPSVGICWAGTSSHVFRSASARAVSCSSSPPSPSTNAARRAYRSGPKSRTRGSRGRSISGDARSISCATALRITPRSSPPRVIALLSFSTLKRSSKGTIRGCPATSALTFTRAASFATCRSETTRNMEAYSWAYFRCSGRRRRRDAAHAPAGLSGTLAHVRERLRLACPSLALHRYEPVRALKNMARDAQLVLVEACRALGCEGSWTTTATTLYRPEERALLVDRLRGRDACQRRIAVVGHHQIVARSDVFPHVVDRDAAIPASRERLSLQLRKAKHGAPLAEVIPGTVHRHARGKLQLAGRIGPSRRRQTLFLPLRKLEVDLACGGAPAP